jgi:hypothetical protein
LGSAIAEATLIAIKQILIANVIASKLPVAASLARHPVSMALVRALACSGGHWLNQNQHRYNQSEENS